MNFIVLLYSKKSAAEAHRILVETYGTMQTGFDTPIRFRLLDQDQCETLAEFWKTLQVNEPTVSKHLKVLAAIWVETQQNDYATMLSHVAKPVKSYLETLQSEVLPHPPYSSDIASSDFHLLRSMTIFRCGIHILPEWWEKCR